MPIYRLTFPNRTPVDVQGVSITTETVTITVSPSLPARFGFHGMRTNGVTAYPPNAFAYMWSWSQPYLFFINRGNGTIAYRMAGTNQLGQYIEVNDQFYAHVPGSCFITPGVTTITRCDALITTATGNVLKLQGINSQACPTWVTIPDNDCSPDEIKCADLSDPKGFCCISCNSLNSKIRTLI